MRRGHSPDEVSAMLALAERRLAEGARIVDVVRELGVSRMTYYRWRREGGLSKQELARRVQELEREVAALRIRLGDMDRNAVR